MFRVVLFLLDIYWNILTMHGPINVKSPNNTSKWQIGFNSAFKGLNLAKNASNLMTWLHIIFIDTFPPSPSAFNIQGVPGGKDLTSGECSLGQTIPI
jgi:hypothetical protein